MRALLAVVALFFVARSLTAVEPAPPPNPPAAEVVEKLPPPPPAEVLSRIKAPPVKPVIKTKQGYTVEVDRSQQILRVSVPKKDIWISPQVEDRQTVEVITEGAPLQQKTTVLAKLKKGRILYTTAMNGDWAQVQILENGKTVRGWVNKKNLKPVAEDYPPAKSLSQNGADFASAAMLIQKAKQFDDGLYAAVELAMQDGLGPITGKREWLPRVAAAVDEQSGKPLAQLYAAMNLGGQNTKPSPALLKQIEAELKEFQADEKRSKPLGFYNWSPQLENIFRQDRMLQTPFEVKQQQPALLAIGRALAADAAALRSYEAVLKLNERLTNKLTNPGFRPVIAAVSAEKRAALDPQLKVSFFPPSRSHEGDLVMKLYGDRPIPAGFELMTEVIARLKTGRLSFQPREDSGWYDHQLFSLEPLVRFDATPEAKQVQPNDEYRKHLEELFKGTYALMRETHVKQLELPAPASEAPGPPPVEREKVYIQPDPHVELLPTMFVRRAASYRFVRNVLIDTFGEENVAKMHRLTAGGPVETNLLAELDQLAGLFGGAYFTACREIGLTEEAAAEIGNGRSADEQSQVFLRWVASLRSDPDLAPDARMMVPVFYDQQRKKTKVWLMLGWESAHSNVDYARHPAVKITDRDGKPVADDAGPEIIYYSSYRSLATPVFAEVYVTKLLNRVEFRQHCDAYQTKAAIIGNLE